jgi:hypothetical protein
LKKEIKYFQKAPDLVEEAVKRMFGLSTTSGYTNSTMRELMRPMKTGTGGVIKKNRKEFEKHRLFAFHKTREFRKKIA